MFHQLSTLPIGVLSALVILVLGVIHILWILWRNNRDKALVNAYYMIVTNLPEKIKNQEDYSNDAVWILQNTKKMAKAINASMYSAVWGLKREITNHNKIGISHECRQIGSDGIVWMSDLDAARRGIKLQLLNPFIWFYRGIELVTYIVFGYLIRVVNPTYDFKNKVWIWFNTIFSLASGLASILSYVITVKNQ